jgi:hypothetical protein
VPAFHYVKNPPPALKAFLAEREKHTASTERMNKLAEAALAEQEEAAAREAACVQAKRPRLVKG